MATLSFAPSAKTVAVGDTFTITVDVTSPTQAMNAASGEVLFSSDKLRVLSVSKDDSVMNLWVQNPSFSNAAGSVDFAGIALNPGFTGTNGNVVTITFRATGTGDTSLSLVSGSVLANDGKGTNILTSLGTGEIDVVPATASVAPPATTVSPAATTSIPTTSVPTAPTTTTTTIPLSPQIPSNTAPPPSPVLATTFALAICLLLLGIGIMMYAMLRQLLRIRRPAAGRNILEKENELREDLMRIEKEMETGTARERQENVRREIGHLEKDIAKEKENLTKDDAA